MKRRGWSSADRREAANRVLAGEDSALVAIDFGVKPSTLARWVEDRRMADASLAEHYRRMEQMRADADLVASLWRKGHALLEIDRRRFLDLLELVDATIDVARASRNLQGLFSAEAN